VHHDAELPGLGPIGHLKYITALESRLPNGETIPTLPEVLSLLGDLDGFTWTNACQPNEGTALYGISLMARF